MTSLLVYIIVGGLIGWIASMLMHTNGRQGILLNMVVGIVGAFIAGLLLTPLFGILTISPGSYSLPGLLITLGGAVILLAIVNTLRRGRVR